MPLSQNIIDKIEAQRGHFPPDQFQSLLIPLLHLIQEEKGHVSVASMREAALYLNLPLSKVREVATFYSMFDKEEKGKYHLKICTNISCWLNGAEEIMHCAQKRLGICCGETTANKNFSLSETECLASCGTGPVMMVNNEHYFEKINEKILLDLIDKWDQV